MATKRQFHSFLPAAACEKEMAMELENMATVLEISKAEIMREALRFYLPRLRHKVGKITHFMNKQSTPQSQS